MSSRSIEITSVSAPAQSVEVIDNPDNEGAQRLLRDAMAKTAIGNGKYLDGITTSHEAAPSVDTAVEHETSPAEIIGAPTGFPETKDIEAVLQTTNPLTISWRTKFMYAVNWPITTVYGKMFDNAQKHSQKLQGWSDAERQAHVEKVGRRSTAVAALGALGLAAWTAITKTNMLDFNAGGSSSNLHEQGTSHGNIALMDNEQHNASSGSTVRSSVESEANYDTPQPGVRHELGDFTYNPAQDPTLSPLKHGNDFGPAPNVDPHDVKANMNAAADSWRHSPGSFATVMSKLGLVKNDAGSINQLAEQMKADPKLFQSNYNAVMQQLGDANIRVEPVTGPYGSYYAVNVGGGKSVIAYDNYVQGGGFMLVVEPKNAPAFCLHEDCDYQPSDYVKQVPIQSAAPQYQNNYAPAPTPERSVPVTPSTPDTPVTPQVPEIPSIPEIPTTPGTPETPVTPPVLAPKTNQYPSHPNLTTTLGSGDLMQTPVPVEKHVTTQTGRDVGGGKVEQPTHDTVTNNRGSQTGGQSHDTGVKTGRQDTSKNPNAGKGVGAGDTSGNKNTTTVGSR